MKPFTTTLIALAAQSQLIDDLEHGRAVDPAEIDRALGQAGRGAW